MAEGGGDGIGASQRPETGPRPPSETQTRNERRLTPQARLYGSRQGLVEHADSPSGDAAGLPSAGLVTEYPVLSNASISPGRCAFLDIMNNY